MPVSTTAPASTYRPGLVAVPVTGIGLTASAAADLQTELALAQSLRDSIVEAIRRARAAAVNAFTPDSDLLQMPDGLASTQRSHNGVSMSTLDFLFAKVVGCRYEASPTPASRAALYKGLPEYGVLDLGQWSQAAEALDLFTAQARSRLSPGQGGGMTYEQGAWYVNGERFSMAELFVAVRMANFAASEQQLLNTVNILNVNSEFARDTLNSLSEMLVIRSNRATASTNGTATYDPTKDFKDVIEKARDGRTHTMAEYEALGKKFPNSAIKLAADSQRAGMTMTSTDYASLLSEMKSLFDTLNADNQVQQVQPP